MPPLTCIVSPVTYDAISEDKKATVLDTSSPEPNLLIGILEMSKFLYSSDILSVILVFIKPGDTQFINIFFFAYSMAKLYDIAIIPALEAA